MKRKKEKSLVASIRIPLGSRVGGPMRAKKGGRYNRADEKRAARKEEI